MSILSSVAMLNSSTASAGVEHVTEQDPVYNNLGDLWDYGYLAMSVLWLLVGVPGNFLVFLSCIIFKEMRWNNSRFPSSTNCCLNLGFIWRTITMSLLGNLALGDFLVCSANVLAAWIMIVVDREFLRNSEMDCVLTGYLCGIGCIGSVVSICSIAINRYYFPRFSNYTEFCWKTSFPNWNLNQSEVDNA